ncbi:MAG: TetR-like C-terminal domain-containing protein [Chloroflexota bacterium]
MLKDLKIGLAPPQLPSGALNPEAPSTNFTLLLTHIAEHAGFYKLMLGPTGAGIFANHLRDQLKGFIASRWAQLTENQTLEPLMPTDLILDFYASAYVGAIAWWINQSSPTPVDEMVRHLTLLTTSTSYTALGIKRFDQDETPI